MSEERAVRTGRVERLDTLVRDSVTDVGVAPCAVAGWLHAGREDLAWGGSGADDASVFDLASLTKTCVALTAFLAARSFAFDLDRPAADFFADLVDTPGGQASLRALLSHRSGLAPHRRLYRESWAGRPVFPSRLVREAAQISSGNPPSALYSDLGYIVAGAVLEVITGGSLDALIEELLARPFGLEIGSVRILRARGLVRFVPTEVQPSRGGLICGAVHDDNAWALGGLGVAGHAGLFGTLSSVVRLGGLLVRSLAEETALSAVTRSLLTPGRDGLGAGVMFPSGPASQAGALAGPRCFGHLGFTGTSLWCDPDRGVATVLLTNRVFPRRNKGLSERGIAATRRDVHDALWGHADGP